MHKFLFWLLVHVKVLEKFQARRPMDDPQMSKVVDSCCLKNCHWSCGITTLNGQCPEDRNLFKLSQISYHASEQYEHTMLVQEMAFSSGAFGTHFAPMIEVITYQRCVTCCHAKAPASILFQSWDHFWHLLDNQPSFRECPVGIEGDEPVPRNIFHNKSQMEFCDGMDCMFLKNCHNIDFSFGARIYQVDGKHCVSFSGKIMFRIDSVARVLHECEKRDATAWQHVEVQIVRRKAPRMDQGKGCRTWDDSSCVHHDSSQHAGPPRSGSGIHWNP